MGTTIGVIKGDARSLVYSSGGSLKGAGAIVDADNPA